MKTLDQVQRWKIELQKKSRDLGIGTLTFGAYQSECSLSSSHEILALERLWRSLIPIPPFIYR